MQFSFSRAYADATRMVGERFGPMLGILAIFVVLMFAIMFLFGASMVPMMTTMGQGMADASAAPGAGFWVTYALVYVAILVISIANFGSLVTMASPLHRPSFGDAIGDGFKATPTGLVVMIVAGIGAFVLLLLISLVTGGAAAASGSSAMAMLGFVVMAVVFGYFVTKLSMVMPIIVIEKERNPFTAMARSWTQTNGHGLMVFLCFFVFYLAVGAVLLLVVMGFAGSFMGAAAGGEMPGIGTVIVALVLYLAFVIAMNLFATALTAAIHAQLTGATTEGYTETFA